jgi:DNA repair protein SbcD/Mre11
MKILHTSDWHLGKRLDVHDRIAEQGLALAWLRETILEAEITVLVVAGDVFDTATPPNEARRLYYNFLSSLLGTPCRNIVIIGGNHDSPAMLGADKDLLEALNIYVVGGAMANVTDEIVLLRNAADEVEGLVAAVPFLHERDLRQSNIYDTIESRFVAIQTGIKAHYDELGAAITTLKAQYKVPALATGHLFALNSSDDKEKGSRIYVGNLENIAATDFHSAFDYVALGHIHRAQALLPHVCYSGSLIPLSFSEIRTEKSVFVLDFSLKNENTQAYTPNISKKMLPVFRKLVQIKGSLESVELELSALQPAATGLASWVEVIIESDTPLPNISEDLSVFIQKLPLEIIKYSVILSENKGASIQDLEGQALKDLDVEDVFLKKCAIANHNEAETAALQQTFLELRDLSVF